MDALETAAAGRSGSWNQDSGRCLLSASALAKKFSAPALISEMAWDIRLALDILRSSCDPLLNTFFRPKRADFTARHQKYRNHGSVTYGRHSTGT